ncbi:transcriptional regulator [Clostridium sp. KNHs214]|uniref:transcriptional regulator n=1 Tax=Clostridium sp. KNHs214 TaxID=1540257 RepID=UPI00054F790B|nr:transcriptional regulator [Clostridium sp. KNHs214]
MSSFYRVDDVREILGISESKAYKIIQQLNKELKEKGYITIAGRVPIKYFKEKYYC